MQTVARIPARRRLEARVVRVEVPGVAGALHVRHDVMAYMKSAGNAWDLNTDYPRFQAALAQMLGELCIDTGHLFAMGHSSGAQFIASMLAKRRGALRRGGPGILLSLRHLGARAHDADPRPDGYGAPERPERRHRHHPIHREQPVHRRHDAGRRAELHFPGQGRDGNAGCVQYNGCAAPTFFCNHNDPNYIDGARNDLVTNHGWPCFANSEILAVFESLR